MARRKKRKFNLGEYVPEVESSVKRGIFIVFIFLLAVLSLLSIFDLAGIFGRYFYQFLKLLFGWGFWMFPIVLAVTGYLSLQNTRHSFKDVSWIGMFLLIIGYSGFFHLTQNPDAFKEILTQGIGGGYIGYGIALPLFKLMGRWASMAVVIAIFLIGLMFMFNRSIEDIFAKISMRGIRDKFGGRFSNEEDEEEDDEDGVEEEDDEEVEFEEREVEDSEEEKEEVENEEKEEEERVVIKKKVKREFPKIDLPLSLLSNKVGKSTSGDIKRDQIIIEKTLATFGIQVEMGEYSVGPTVTQYTFRPAEGVKLSRIIGLSNNLALALAAHSIRIEAPIPGKSLVGIEVPNEKTAIVPLRKILESKEFKNRSTNLSLALGDDVSGNAIVADLAKLPHLLVAGQTGSGKTVCLNSLIISLLYQNQPDELKLILVDPKQVDMPAYNDIPHLLTPVITEPKRVLSALRWSIGEMNRRLKILNMSGKKNIKSYNVTHKKDKLPYIIFIIDELAALMGIIGRDLEIEIAKITSLGRAAGLHLILATQRPDVKVITGTIKANIPGRISFSVYSAMDSRTILDVSGGEKLIGNGDMLFKSDQVPNPKRLQGAFCQDEEINKIVSYLKNRAVPDYDETVIENPNSLGLGGLVTNGAIDVDEEYDEKIDEAREAVVEVGKASASYLQRKLKIGYSRAARILDQLEEKGIIGPADGSKPREVLIKPGEESLVEQADTLLEQVDDIEDNIEEENSSEENYEEDIDEVDEDEEVDSDDNQSHVEVDEVIINNGQEEVNAQEKNEKEVDEVDDETVREELEEKDETEENDEDKYNF